MLYPFNSSSRLTIGALLILLAGVIFPLAAQSNHASALMAGGAWRLHARVPLGFDALLLQHSRISVHILASVEVPEFVGWTLTIRDKLLVLLLAVECAVESMTNVITFRVYAV